MTLKELKDGQSARILETGGNDPRLRGHLLDMGLIPGTRVKLLKRAPMGDPISVIVYGYALSLAASQAELISVEPVEEEQDSEASPKSHSSILFLHEHNSHPGFGEEGKYHDHTVKSLPETSELRIAIVGQQNSGKTLLFNRLTDSKEHVGSFPGITVETNEGVLKGFRAKAKIYDLPGFYSLSAFNEVEQKAQEWLIRERPHAIINIVDATNIVRHLYLSVQLMELGIPMVLALNMMDELTQSGGGVRVNEMESLLGIPVVPVSALTGEGVDELVDHALHIARYQETPVLHGISDKDMPSGLDQQAAMAHKRFHFIRDLCSRTIIRPEMTKQQELSSRIDRILIGKWTAVPAFIAIFALIFWLTFDLVGGTLQELLAAGIGWLGGLTSRAMESLDVHPAVYSLVIDAIFEGVGTVVSFLPIILVLFGLLAILEDSGYMSRVAFVSDKLMRRFGLSGRSIIPLLTSFGCSVPGVMASRTLSSASDRRAAILLTPFMSCTAKMAIYGFFVEAFFPNHGVVVMLSLYLLGILVGLLTAIVRKHLGHKYKPSPFVMEIPVYRLPSLSNVGHLLWDKMKDFISSAMTVILIATIAIWALRSFSWNLSFVEDSSQSIMAYVSGLIAPIFEPIGLGDWRIITSLISGLMAKEGVVATMGMLGAEDALTVVTAVPMLIFCLLYTPCAAALTAIGRELGRRWAWYVAFFQCIVAWVVAWIGYIVALWIYTI
ncbi:MAG: FeoA domain-containing protein [Bacteroidales bacterium]|nr:FeoA domain-containing protein [Bacteroidales bacterium]